MRMGGWVGEVEGMGGKKEGGCGGWVASRGAVGATCTSETHSLLRNTRKAEQFLAEQFVECTCGTREKKKLWREANTSGWSRAGVGCEGCKGVAGGGGGGEHDPPTITPMFRN